MRCLYLSHSRCVCVRRGLNSYSGLVSGRIKYQVRVQCTRRLGPATTIATHVIYSIFLAVMVASAGVAAYLIALSIVQDENGAGGDKSVGAPVGNTERTSSLDATVTIWTSIWLGILFILLTVLGVKTLLAVTIKQVAMSRRKRSEVWLYGLSRFLSLSLSLSLRT